MKFAPTFTAAASLATAILFFSVQSLNAQTDINTGRINAFQVAPDQFRTDIQAAEELCTTAAREKASAYGKPTLGEISLINQHKAGWSMHGQITVSPVDNTGLRHAFDAEEAAQQPYDKIQNSNIANVNTKLYAPRSQYDEAHNYNGRQVFTPYEDATLRKRGIRTGKYRCTVSGGVVTNLTLHIGHKG
jgi:hypothetical protein